jgi:YVTN family beta-propeller protein
VVAYVGSDHTDTVTPISTVTNTAEKAIKVATGPVAVAFTPDGKTAYVVSLGADTVTPISTATNTPGTPIKVGVHPYAIAITVH